MKYCAQCGNQVEDGVKFCPECGKEIGAATPTPTPEPTPAPQPIEPVSDDKKSKKDKPEKKGKGKIIAIVVAILLIVGMIGSCGSEETESQSSNDPQPVQPSQQEETDETVESSVDVTLLQNIMQNAIGINADEFTAESYAALTDAINAGQAVLADANATQEQVDDARNAITDAISALVEREQMTMGQKNALRSAENYLDLMPFSHDGLIDQLEFEGYTTEDATYAADNCGADWFEMAAWSAQNYIDIMSFSKQGLIDQLVFEGFTQEQAEYGVEAVGY